MPAIDDINLLDLNGVYSYKDYLTWNFQERIELIKGKIFKMSPAPRRIHQEISLKLVLQIGLFLRNKPCKLYDAPFDVRLVNRNTPLDIETYTVVQPDLCVICDESKLDDRGCVGVPDLIVEILSPSTSKKDAKDKFQLYQESGVREYWMVHIEEKLVDVFRLEGEKYQLDKIYTVEDQIDSQTIKGLRVDLNEVFEV